MAEPKRAPKPTTLREPKPKKNLGLRVPPALRMPHEDLFRSEIDASFPSPPEVTPAITEAEPRIPPSEGSSIGASSQGASADRASTIGASSERASSNIASSQSQLRGSYQPASQVTQSQPPQSQLTENQLTDKLKLNWRAVEHTRVPHEVLDRLIPTLPPMAQTPYLQLLRLTLGFQRSRCRITLERWAERCNQSVASIKRQAAVLEKNGLARKVYVKFGGEERGSYWEPIIPGVFNDEEGSRLTESQLPESQPRQSQLRQSHMKHDDDHDLERKQSSSNARARGSEQDREARDETMIVISSLYQTLTGRPWLESDTKAYREVEHLGADKLKELMGTIHARAKQPIGSFRYFVKSIPSELSPLGQQSRSALREKYEKFAAELAVTKLGRNEYQPSDRIADLKAKCLREGVTWNDDLANEALGLNKQF